MPTKLEIETAARAYLDFDSPKEQPLYSRVEAAMEAALVAAEGAREPVVFTTADGSHRCTVNGPQHIVVERLKAPGTA